MRPRRPSARRPAAPGPLVAAGVALLVAGSGAAPASAAKRHAPCPTTGTTLYRAGKYASPGLRVYRVGTALRSCTRNPGQRRRIRSLGAWTPATKVVVGGGTLVWTTRRTAPDGTAADTIREVAITGGRRTLTVTKTAVATSPTSPATPDTVVGLETDGFATAWVTSRGRLAAAVSLPRSVPEPDPEDGPPPYREGSIYAIADIGPAQASALAKGFRLLDDSETDDCGGTLSRRLLFPAVEGFPAGQFAYFREEATPSPGCS